MFIDKLVLFAHLKRGGEQVAVILLVVWLTTRMFNSAFFTNANYSCYLDCNDYVSK